MDEKSRRSDPMSETTANVLLVNCSPRPKNNTSVLLDQVSRGISEVRGCSTSVFEFHGRSFAGCRATCLNYCSREGDCCIRDGLQEFMVEWRAADAVVFCAPVYLMGPPASVRALFERLVNVQLAYLREDFPRANKVCGAVMQGHSRWGGQEIALQYFAQQTVLMNCIPVSGDMPGSYLGVAGHAPTLLAGSITEDAVALSVAKNLGRRIAETALIVRAGTEAMASSLPDIYFPARVLEKRKSAGTEVDEEWRH